MLRARGASQSASLGRDVERGVLRGYEEARIVAVYEMRMRMAGAALLTARRRPMGAS
jgi:hypothetical protein